MCGRPNPMDSAKQDFPHISACWIQKCTFTSLKEARLKSWSLQNSTTLGSRALSLDTGPHQVGTRDRSASPCSITGHLPEGRQAYRGRLGNSNVALQTSRLRALKPQFSFIMHYKSALLNFSILSTDKTLHRTLISTWSVNLTLPLGLWQMRTDLAHSSSSPHSCCTALTPFWWVSFPRCPAALSRRQPRQRQGHGKASRATWNPKGPRDNCCPADPLSSKRAKAAEPQDHIRHYGWDTVWKQMLVPSSPQHGSHFLSYLSQEMDRDHMYPELPDGAPKAERESFKLSLTKHP